MESFVLITNLQKDQNLVVTNRVCDYLVNVKKKKAKTIVLNKRNEDIPKEALQTADCAIVLGGDGTILRVARQIVSSGLPIVGINMGHLGYLAEVDKDSAFAALDALCDGEYTTQNRMMLSGKGYSKETEICNTAALNDIVISHGGTAQILNFEVLVNGKVLKSYRADGVILSTPTGSTAYNLSAGGPIVEPGADMILVTPIAPHTMLSRSIIFKAEDEIEVRILPPHEPDPNQYAEVLVDGSSMMKLQPGDRVIVTRSSLTTTLIRLSSVSFLETLYEKMKER